MPTYLNRSGEQEDFTLRSGTPCGAVARLDRSDYRLSTMIPPSFRTTRGYCCRMKRSRFWWARRLSRTYKSRVFSGLASKSDGTMTSLGISSRIASKRSALQSCGESKRPAK